MRFFTPIENGFLQVFLKMWSYVQVNLWCREHARGAAERRGGINARSPSLAEVPRDRRPSAAAAPVGVGGGAAAVDANRNRLVQYPDNLTVTDIFYFWLAPTLCYELNFPKMERVRKL
jgi:diacylglycerol O-acyltransferase-1